jgi:hypothetical protein
MDRTRCKTLPDELLERIIARVPFPAIHRARILSKAWRARFSQVSLLRTTEEKSRANAFQKLVRERSNTWGTLAPVSIGEIAHNSASHTWHKMPDAPWEDSLSQMLTGPLLLSSRRKEDPLWSKRELCQGEERPDHHYIEDDDVITTSMVIFQCVTISMMLMSCLWPTC